MKRRSLFKALAVMLAFFVVVIVSLVLLDPNVKNLFSNDEDELKPGQAYEIEETPKKDNITVSEHSSSSNKTSKPSKDSEEDIYANQLLGNSPNYIGYDCSYCGGVGKERCPSCYGVGESTRGSVCNNCYGEGYVYCEYCH